MVDEEKVVEAIEALKEQLSELTAIVYESELEKDYTMGVEKFRRWVGRARKLIEEKISVHEADKFSLKGGDIVTFRDPREELIRKAKRKHVFLSALIDELENYPDVYLKKGNEVGKKPVGGGKPGEAPRIVFIVHGHDEENLLRLEKLLEDRWGLEVKLLRARPQKSRAVLDKFEQEAQDATFAFALFTPDDEVVKEEDEYKQPRPNVFFELGWFYGKLGRVRVCIICKKGTKIPSDLEGIARIDFEKFVNEKIEEIETELRAAGLIS